MDEWPSGYMVRNAPRASPICAPTLRNPLLYLFTAPRTKERIESNSCFTFLSAEYCDSVKANTTNCSNAGRFVLASSLLEKVGAEPVSNFKK